MNLETFISAYVRAALWSETDDSGEPLDANYAESDIAPAAMARIRADCAAFLAHQMVVEYLESDAFFDMGSDYVEVAYDFWLTRNGHGAGFWDGDYPAPWDDRLTIAAESFGWCDMYLGDDGMIHCSRE